MGEDNTGNVFRYQNLAATPLEKPSRPIQRLQDLNPLEEVGILKRGGDPHPGGEYTDIMQKQDTPNLGKTPTHAVLQVNTPQYPEQVLQ